MRRMVGTALSALLLAGCAGGGGSAGGGHDHAENSPVVEGAREIEVRAANLRFAPEEIEVAAGEDVAIVLTAADITHDFTIEELDVHVGADGGRTARGGLRADEPGTYTYLCTVPGHAAAGMEGTLTVTEA